MHLSDVEALRKVFDAIDLDKSGTIETTELREALEKAGKKPTDEQVKGAASERFAGHIGGPGGPSAARASPHTGHPLALRSRLFWESMRKRTRAGARRLPAAVPCTPPALSFRRGVGGGGGPWSSQPALTRASPRASRSMSFEEFQKMIADWDEITENISKASAPAGAPAGAPA